MYDLLFSLKLQILEPEKALLGGSKAKQVSLVHAMMTPADHIAA